MAPGGSGTRQDNITTDQGSPQEGGKRMEDDESAMTPRDAPDDDAEEDADETTDDGVRPYRDEEE